MCRAADNRRPVAELDEMMFLGNYQLEGKKIASLAFLCSAGFVPLTVVHAF